MSSSVSGSRSVDVVDGVAFVFDGAPPSSTMRSARTFVLFRLLPSLSVYSSVCRRPSTYTCLPARRFNRHQGDDVRQVVVPAGRMVDRAAAPACGTAFQCAELRVGSGMVEQ